jgi:hypothetical protein
MSHAEDSQNNGNHNPAVESDAENMTSKILFFCLPEEKSAWVRAAKPGKLSAWIRHQLNQASGVQINQPTKSGGAL